MNPARSISSLRKNITGTIRYNDNDFQYTIYPNPIHKTKEEQEELITLFGNRLQKGSHCLGITPSIVRDNINKKNYDALVYVKNMTIDDSATGALQYWNWCDKTSRNRQLWINDLCRVNNSGLSGHDIISPIRVLFDIVEDFSKSRGILENYLIVDPGKNATAKLLEIYGAYRFAKNDSCTDNSKIVMKKLISSSGGKSKRNTRKNKH